METRNLLTRLAALTALAGAAACADGGGRDDERDGTTGDAAEDTPDTPSDSADGDASSPDGTDTTDSTDFPGDDVPDTGDVADGTPPEPLTWEVDATIEALPSLDHPRVGMRPVGAVREGNVVVSYVSNEVLLRTSSVDEAEAFAERWDGEVLFTDVVPEPPATLGVTLSEEARRPTLFVVRVDPSLADAGQLAELGAAIGLGGHHVFSDATLAQLWTVAAQERADGFDTALNVVFEPTMTPLVRTSDGPAWSEPLGAWTNDAFQYDAWDLDGQYGSSSLARAWQLLFAHGWQDTITVAILDGGFWVDNTGTVQSAEPGIADFPFQVVQHDFWEEDGNAGGSNPNHCTGGSACPWHGWHCASAATAEPDNGYGAAGSGGWVAVPWFFRFGFESGSQWTALRTAIEWRADVVSMSYSGSCSKGCLFWSAALHETIRQNADANNVVLVAAAGNDTAVVDADGTRIPCVFSICIGALADRSTDRISYSNWGAHVDLFAPTNIPASPDPASSGALVNAGGTSASTPLVAGVIAMMKAMDRTLDTSRVETLLRATARTDSSDPRVTRILDAYEALLAAMGGQLEADSWEPDNARSSAVDGGIGPTIFLVDRTDPTGLDFDWVRYRLDEWSRVSVELTHMPGLSAIDSTFYSDAGPAWAWNHISSQRDDGTTWEITDVPPGDHFVLVTADAPTRYDQWIRITETPLEPDPFEANDTRGTSRSLPVSTTHAVTLHTASDVDHYTWIATPPNAVMANRLRIVGSTFPVRVSISTTTDPTPLFSAASVTHEDFVVGSGDYIIRIESTGQPTRYGIQVGQVWNVPNLEDEYRVPPGIPQLEPGDPIEGWLLDARGLLGWIRNSDTGWVTGIELDGPGIDGTLLDSEGGVLDPGVRLVDGATEAFTVPAGGPEQGYVLLLAREAAMPTDDAAVPALHYSVRLTGAR